MAEVLWPEREPLYDLMCHRAAVGPAAFNTEKQNIPVNPELCEWDDSYFNYPGFWFEAWPQTLAAKVLALDPSKGKDARVGDYSAFVRLGVEPLKDGGYLYCEADLRRRPADVIARDGVSHFLDFAPDAFCLEANQFQDLLKIPLRLEAQARGVLDLRLCGVDNTVNKVVRIRRLGPYLAQRRLRFKTCSPGTLLLVRQMQEFAAGDHDDGPDALEMADRTLRWLLQGHRAGAGQPEVMRA